MPDGLLFLDNEDDTDDGIWCPDCHEPLVTDEGDPRACACEREAQGEHRWECEDER